MTIQITRPEIEALIFERLQTGVFKDAEDVVFQALQYSQPKTARSEGTPSNSGEPAKDMVELFAPLRGLNIDFESDRGKDIGRDIHL